MMTTEREDEVKQLRIAATAAWERAAVAWSKAIAIGAETSRVDADVARKTADASARRASEAASAVEAVWRMAVAAAAESAEGKRP